MPNKLKETMDRELKAIREIMYKQNDNINKR